MAERVSSNPAYNVVSITLPRRARVERPLELLLRRERPIVAERQRLHQHHPAGFPGNINPEKRVEDAVPCQRPRRAPAFHRPAVDSESPSKLVGRTRQANGILDQLRNRAPQLRELHRADLVVTHLRHRLRPQNPLAAEHPAVQHHPLELQVIPRRRVEAAAAAEELHRLHRLRRRFYKTPIRLPQLKRHHPRLLFRRNVEERVRHPQRLEDVPPKIFLQRLPAHLFHQFSQPVVADSIFPVRSWIEHERRLQKRVAIPRNRGSQSRLHVLVQPHIEKVVAKPRSVRQQLPHRRRRLRWPQLRLFRRRIEFLEHLHLRQFREIGRRGLVQLRPPALHELQHRHRRHRLGHRSDVENRVQRHRNIFRAGALPERPLVNDFVSPRRHRHHPRCLLLLHRLPQHQVDRVPRLRPASRSQRQDHHPRQRRCRQQASPHRPSNRLHPFHSRPLSYVQLLAHDNHQSFSFSFRLRQPHNNCGKFIEYLVPALELTALDCVLHGLISNESEFRLAVPNILKKHYVVHALDGLMFCSLRLNPVSLRVGKVHRRNDLLVRNNLMVFTTIPALLPIRCSHAKQKFPSHAKIYLANGRSKALRSPPLHHVLRVCPRLPN